MSRLRWATVAAIAVLVVTACSGAGHHPPTPTTVPVPTTGTVPVSIPAAMLIDPGLPSQVGRPPLTNATVKQLMQYFEDSVSQAYANGDADSLYRYLAGPMLTGNRGTINLLSNRHQRNVFKITVNSVTVDTTDNSRVVLSMTGDETVNYLYDTTTNKQVAPGLATAGPVQFEVFLDFNPDNHTWYWTGEKSTASKATSGAGGA